MKQDIHSPPPVTWTGTRDFPLLNPSVDDFEVPAIVRSLCRRPRYGGFSDIDVSVGAHTLLCDAIWRILYGGQTRVPLPQSDGCTVMLHYVDARRAVVIHDFPEAYLSDIQRPLKVVPDFEFYRKLEARYEGLMQQRWLPHIGDNVSEAVAAIVRKARHDMVKKVDNLALSAEVHYAMPAVLDKWGSLPDTTEEMRDVAKLFIDLSDEEAEHTLLQVCADTGVT